MTLSAPALARSDTTAPTGAADDSGLEEGGEEPSGTASRPGRLRRAVWIVGLAVTALGLVLALFAGYVFGFTAVQATQAQRNLLETFHGPAGLAALTGRVPAEGRPVALLTIPALGVNQVVVEGTSARDLLNGPGLMPGSALPGVRGNTVIAARRELYGGPFADLARLRPGDRIVVVGGFGRFDYRVVRALLVSPGHADPIVPTADARLTLVTSDGSLVPSDRLAVVAQMTSRPVEVGITDQRVPPLNEQGLNGDVHALAPALLWGALLVLGVAATVVLYRRWPHPSSLWLLCLPVLLALAVLCFQNVVLLMPATL